MARVVLKVEERAVLGSRGSRRIRREGKVPLVLYGLNKDTLTLLVGGKEIRDTIRSGARIISLNWDNKEELALLKDLQYDTVSREILHADFLRIAMDKSVEVKVPIELKGVPQGVSEGGSLEQALREVLVECLPGVIPDRLTVDVSAIVIGEVLYLKDVSLPAGVKFVGENLDIPVAAVRKPVEEVAKPAAEEEEVSKEPELIRRPKKEEEVEET